MPRPIFLPQDQNEWLLGIGQRLRAEYDVLLAAPLPPRLAALVKQLENSEREPHRVSVASAFEKSGTTDVIPLKFVWSYGF